MLRATTVCNFLSLIWPDGSAPAAVGRLLFDFLGPQIIGKQTESRLSYLSVRLPLLSSHFFSSLIFSLLLFSSLTLPASAFPYVHIVGSLTSKLPSTNFVSYVMQLPQRSPLPHIGNPFAWRQGLEDQVSLSWYGMALVTFQTGSRKATASNP